MARELERSHPGAGASLREGHEETITLQRLGASELQRTLASTNPCESMIEIVRHTQRNVKRWSGGEMRLRWTAAGMLEAERQFRKIIGYRDLANLAVARRARGLPLVALAASGGEQGGGARGRYRLITSTGPPSKFYGDRDILAGLCEQAIPDPTRSSTLGGRAHPPPARRRVLLRIPRMTALGTRAWVEVPRNRETLVVPLGATEQHGPHLPMSTDTDIAVALAERVAHRLPDVVAAPAVAYGASAEHQEFPGTVSIGQEATDLMLVELARSASATFPRVALLNCHGGNAATVANAVKRVRSEDRDVRAWSPTWTGDAHAGSLETSIMLALDPGRVRMAEARAGERRPLAELMPALRARGVRAVSPSGVLGDPTGASRSVGEALLSQAVERFSHWLAEWQVGDGSHACRR